MRQGEDGARRVMAHDNDRILADLNEPQRRAVAHRDGPLLVLAGPGSGKTRVITRRAAYLVQSGVAPYSIVCITFTNKAAEEMKHRIHALGVDRGMWIYTFHALGVRLLSEFGHLVGLRRNFTIYDESDQVSVIKEAMAACEIPEGMLRADDVRGDISRAKNRLETPGEYAKATDFFETRAKARIYEAYQGMLEQRNAVDFDDLLMKVALLLRENAGLTRQLNDRFRYVLIDEYQDTNRAQYLIAKHLAQHHRNICATGDPDQSIYGWRGADLNNILEFEQDYPDAVTVRLEQNYRSTGSILRAASTLIRANRKRKHKKLWTENGEGEPVSLMEFGDGEDEARQVAARIAEMRRAGRAYSDFAVFYRVNAISRGLEEALRDEGIPYRIARGLEFYNRREIKDVLAYLRVLANPDDRNSLLRIINTPARGIGKVTVDRLIDAAERESRPLVDILGMADQVGEIKAGAAAKIRDFAAKLEAMRPFAEGKVAPAITAVLEISGLEKALKHEAREEDEAEVDRWANVQELITAAVRYDETAESPDLADFLRRIALTSDQDAVDESAGVVMLMTLHAAKGLEFPVVFLTGMEQGMLPHERSLRLGQDVEEERRLCFVGITRARELLFLSRADRRMVGGITAARCASEFLRDLAGEDLRRERFGYASGAEGASRWGGGVGAGSGGFDSRAGGLNSRSGAADDDDLDFSPEKLEARGAPMSGGGYEPMTDHLPPEETMWRPKGTGSSGSAGDERRRVEFDEQGRRGGFQKSKWPARKPGGSWSKGSRSGGSGSTGSGSRGGKEDETPVAPVDKNSPFADWGPGTVVQHAKYGVGQVVWIRPGAGQTRAGVKFPNQGEKVFVLEVAPIRKLARRS